MLALVAAVKLMKLLEVEFYVEYIYQRVSLAWFSFFSYEDNVYMYRFHSSSYIDASFRVADKLFIGLR